jgi:prephenate dehydratase
MADKARRVDYWYVTVPDRPGEARKVLSPLKEANVNMLAQLAFPTGDGQSQLDLVPENGEAFRNAAAKAGLKLSDSKRAFLVQGDDRAGAVADTLAKLADASVNVTAYAATCADGRYGLLVWVWPADYERAAQALGV